MWESIMGALTNLFGIGSDAGSAAGSAASTAGDVASGAGSFGSTLSGVGSVLGGLGSLGSVGLGIYGLANQGGQQPQTAHMSPFDPYQGAANPYQAPQPNPQAVKQLVANRQNQGIYSGGASSPESLSALLGEGYDPSFIMQVLGRR